MSTTSEPTTDPLPPQRPLERFAHLETDVFCEGCGYNLHGQPVHRDERLGLLICRCPECGRFHPAGQGTAATSLWMSRLAAWLLFLWVLIVLIAVVFAVVGFGAMQMLPHEIFTTYQVVSPDGRPVHHIANRTGGTSMVYSGTDEPFTGLARPVRMFRALPPEVMWWGWPYGMLALMSAGIGIVSGALLVTFLWHWPRRRYYWGLLLPPLAAGFLFVTMWWEPYMEFVRGWTILQALLWCGVQMAFVFLGIRFGRPFARVLVRMFVPPKPLQHLAFLWQADGKVPPSTDAQPG